MKGVTKMAELKTKITNASVTQFLNRVADEEQRKDSYAILDIMRKATKTEPKMWGSSIVGFGDCHYVYASGREGDWFIAGFSPRKQALTLYSMGGWHHNDELLAKLGKHSFGKGCLYIKRLNNVNILILKKLIAESVKQAKKLQSNAKKQAKQNK